MQIDEPGGDNASLRIDDKSPVCGGKVADRRYAVLANADVAAPAGLPGAVDDRAVANDDVEYW